MTDFDFDFPLLIPTLTQEDKERLRTYHIFYEQHREAFSDWAEEELKDHPAWGGIIQAMSPEERKAQRQTSREQEQEAIFNDNWEPYLKQLGFYGIFYARIGLDFHSWFELVNMVRHYLTPFLLKQGDSTAIINIMTGMDQFMDIAMSSIGEAYLAEKKRIIEIQKHEQELLNKELEHFVYIASHDLQEPLNTVRNFVDLLEEEYGDHFPGEAAEYLSYIRLSASRMTELVTGLLDYSRVGRNREFKIAAIESLVQEVLADMKASIDKNHARIQVAGSLPVLPVSRVEVKMLFQNLFSNAIKFHKKGIAPEVTVSAGKENDMWHFVVEDNGIGMDEKNRDKIFIIFRRLHNAREYEGTGIGLAHCKKIVEQHGGKIWVESKPGTGSKFHFTLSEKQKLE